MMRLAITLLTAAVVMSVPDVAMALPPNATDLVGKAGQATKPLQLLGLLTILSLLPALVLVTTSFTRVVIVLGFVRTGIGSMQTPPTPVIIGISLFLTMFTMAPVLDRVHDEAYEPYVSGRIDAKQAYERASIPMRSFMLKQTREADLALFYNAAKLPFPKTVEEVPMRIAVPAFVISELTTAFQMGVLVLLPFLLIDIATASLLMSMGMMMVPPTTISLPLKLLLFVVVDGWHLLTDSLLRSFV